MRVNLNEILKEFLISLSEEKNFSDHTLKAYSRDLSRFATFIKKFYTSSFNNIYLISIKLNVELFMFGSSSSVYGIKKVRNVVENMKLKPLTDYSKYKARCEKILNKAPRDMNALFSLSDSYFDYFNERAFIIS